MQHVVTTLPMDKLWNVVFQDPGEWRVGIYRPDARSAGEIRRLEQHTCPELFVCIGGRMGLLIREGNEETAFEFSPNQAMLVTGFHNGFAIDREAYFLVVERTDFKTEYIDRP